MRDAHVEDVQIIDRAAGFGMGNRAYRRRASSGQQFGRLEIVVGIRQVHPDVLPLPDITRLFRAGQILHDHRERVAAMNHHRTAAGQVVAKTQEAGERGEFGVIAQQHQPVIVKAHTPAGNVVLRAIIDREAVLPRQFAQVPVVLDVGIALVEAVIVMIAAAEPRVEHGGRVADAIVMPRFPPGGHGVAAVTRVSAPHVGWGHKQNLTCEHCAGRTIRFIIFWLSRRAEPSTFSPAGVTTARYNPVGHCPTSTVRLVTGNWYVKRLLARPLGRRHRRSASKPWRGPRRWDRARSGSSAALPAPSLSEAGSAPGTTPDACPARDALPPDTTPPTRGAGPAGCHVKIVTSRSGEPVSVQMCS